MATPARGSTVTGTRIRSGRDVDSVRLLTEGAVEVKGRMPWSSNATFLAELCLDGTVGLAVYKPERGERPLWDYPPGL